jgi:branched-chain amino acid transport system substrate-binding protein
MKKYLVGLSILLFVCMIASQATAQIKIGATMPLTGYAASYGEDAKRGVELAIDQVNAAGGIRGKKVVVIYEDDAGAGKTGVAAAQKLITVDKVQVIVDAMFTATALPISPMCRENKVVLLGTLVSHPDFTSPGGYLYRCAASDVINANVEAKFAYNVLKMRRAGGLFATNDYAVRFQKIVRERFEKMGGSWLISDEFAQGATDFRTQLAKIKEKNPEVLFVVETHKEAAQMLRQMVELKFKPVVIGTSMFDDPMLMELAGDAAEGVYFSTGAAVAASGLEKKQEEFKKAFKEKFGKDPAICAEHFYDATNLAIEAMKTGGETGPEIDKALSRIKDYLGVTGTITFNAIGDRIFPTTVKKVEKGKFVGTGYIDMGD